MKFDKLQVSDPANGDKRVITLNKYFRLFLVELINMLNTDRILLENKGSAIVRYEQGYVGHSSAIFIIHVLVTESLKWFIY